MKTEPKIELSDILRTFTIVVELIMAGFALFDPRIPENLSTETRQGLLFIVVLLFFVALVWSVNKSCIPLTGTSNVSTAKLQWPLTFLLVTLILLFAAARVCPNEHQLITEPDFGERGLWDWQLKTRSDRSPIKRAQTQEGFNSCDFASLGGFPNDEDQLWHPLHWLRTMSQMSLSFYYFLEVDKSDAQADPCEFRALVRDRRTEETLVWIESRTHQHGPTDGWTRVNFGPEVFRKYLSRLCEAQEPELYFLVKNGANNSVRVRIDKVSVEAYW